MEDQRYSDPDSDGEFVQVTEPADRPHQLPPPPPPPTAAERKKRVEIDAAEESLATARRIANVIERLRNKVPANDRAANEKKKAYEHEKEIWQLSEPILFSDSGLGVRTCFGPNIQRITFGRFMKGESGKMVATGPKLQLSLDDALKLYDVMPTALDLFDAEQEAYEVVYTETLKKRVAREVAAASGNGGGAGRGSGTANYSGGDRKRYKPASSGTI